MADIINNAFAIVAMLFIWTISIFAVSMLLPSKKKSGKKLRNFTLDHELSLLSKDFKCEIFYPFINHYIVAPVNAVIVAALLFLGFDHAPHYMFSEYIALLPFWGQVLIAMFFLDLAIYIRHRFVHTYCWRFHAVHHSAQEITWLTSKRLHPVDSFIMDTMQFAILYVIGFDAQSMLTAMSIMGLYNLFVHCNIVWDYGKPLKYIIVSPSMHRWHHAMEKEAHNKNYCVFFAFFDLAFGTYYVPDNELPESYGAGDKLDDIKNKTILSELYYPFAGIVSKLRQRNTAH